MFIYPFGLTRFSPEYQREVADVTAGPLSTVYQRPWEAGELPAGWRLANVILIYKKGTGEDTGNYRPLS